MKEASGASFPSLAQALARLGPVEGARAVMVAAAGQLSAYHGVWSEEALAALLPEVPLQGESDILRYVRSPLAKAPLMLLATRLEGEKWLVAVFDASHPLSQARRLLHNLAAALTTPTDAAAEEDDDLPPEAFQPLFDDIPDPNPTVPAAPPRPAPPPPAEAQAAVVRPQQAPAPAEAMPPSPQTQAYAGVLVPKHPNQFLVGDLARDLSRWLPRLIHGFGWRLLHFSVQPHYLQWVVEVPPNTPPTAVVRAVRWHTSRLLYQAHPELPFAHPADDFWAPFYLLQPRQVPISSRAIAAFLQKHLRGRFSQG